MLRFVSGYSGTPLARKLGIKEGCRLALLAAPEDFEHELVDLPPDVRPMRRLAPSLDVALLFVTARQDLESRFPKVAASMRSNGGLWVAWPKMSSGVATNLTEDVLREVVLPTGWVDNKVCAITDVWSGLRFVLRKENRPS